MRLVRVLAVISVGLVLAGCGSGGEQDFSKAPLPAANAGATGICAGPAVPPSFEVWAGAADAIVFGTVTAVRPLLEPAVVMNTSAEPPYVDAADCSGSIEAGLVVDLDDVQVLRGQVPAGTLELTLGVEVVQTYAPMPFCFDGKKISWLPKDAPGRIAKGQRIGGVLFEDPDWGYWGPQKAGGVLLWIEDTGIVRAQDNYDEYCHAPVPDGLDGMTLADFEERIAGLDLSDPQVQEQIEIRRTWYDDSLGRLGQYWGAKCFPELVPECQEDADCDSGLFCKDGLCAPECTVDADCGPGELCVDESCEEQ